MSDEFLNQYKKLTQSKTPFATAIVVNRIEPSSGKPGDKAIILQDGTIKGWIGGGCTRGIVLKEALLAIQHGKPRLVNISPDATGATTQGAVSYTMTCQSGGSVSLYIEPVLPRPHILILGKSHIAMALSKIGKVVGYEVTVLAKGLEKEAFPSADKLVDDDQLDTIQLSASTYIVVCTQGENDALALKQAVYSSAEYVSLVASLKKANSVYNDLKKQGVTVDLLKKIKTPAGLNINAKLPEEVAISILAEIISRFRDVKKESEQEAPELDMKEYFINPVCQVPIQKNSAKHIINYKNTDYYFCCDGCKVSFENEPEKYALTER